MNEFNLRTLLKTEVCTVEFTKVNGEKRVMDCTTNMDKVPPSMWPKDGVVKEDRTPGAAIRVFDVKAQGWRSFLPANVTKVSIQ